MTDNQFISIKIFYAEKRAKEIQEILRSHAIKTKLVYNTGNLAKEIIGEAPDFSYELFVLEEDGEQAKIILFDEFQKDIDEVNPNHFLFEYNNDELYRILIERDEWNELDVLLSEKILKSRGVIVDQEELKQKQIERDLELEKPERISNFWLVVGYVCVLIFPLLGVLIGTSFWKGKKRLPNGKRISLYDTMTKNHAQIIFYCSLFHLGFQGIRILGFLREF